MKIANKKTEERLTEIQLFLDARESNPAPAYWQLTDEGDDMEGNYCYDCMIKICPNGEPGKNYIRYGFTPEQDGCLMCDDCGKLLAYTLTNYGVNEELEAYSDHAAPNLTDADICYMLARIAYGVSDADQKRDIIRIVKRGQKALKAH